MMSKKVSAILLLVLLFALAVFLMFFRPALTAFVVNSEVKEPVGLAPGSVESLTSDEIHDDGFVAMVGKVVKEFLDEKGIDYKWGVAVPVLVLLLVVILSVVFHKLRKESHHE